MSQPVLTLELPEDVYERVRRAAKAMKQPVATVLVNIVKGAMPSLEKVPPQYRAELEAMEDLGDEELWKVAKTVAEPAYERKMANLLDKNQQGKMTKKDRKALAELRAAGDRQM